MFFQLRTIPGLAIHSYIVGDEKTKECLVIDPVRDVDSYIEIARQNGLKVRHILETHVHADFVSGAAELKAKLNGEPKIHCSGLGGTDWIPAYADVVVKDGDEIKLGSLTFRAIHTPGHTPEHLMWALFEDGEVKRLFTGDFLFVGDVGRPDLLGKEEMKKLSHQLYHTVFNKLSPFPDSAEVRPAHGAGSLCGKSLGSSPSSTLGEERQKNVSLIEKPEDVWVQDLMRNMPPVPKYFPRMKKINVTGAKILGDEIPGKRAMPLELVKAEIEKGAIVVDVRTKEAFSKGHIPGSINIPFCPQLSTWAGWVLPVNPRIILLIDDEKHLTPVVESFLRIGMDDISGFVEGGMEAWENQFNEVNTLEVISTDDLNHLLQSGKKPFVLDVRTNEEWELGHIKDAVHIFGGVVQENLGKLPKDQPISVICNSGFRASVVSSLLLREGIKDVSNVGGGMAEWRKRHLPVLQP